MVEAVPCAVALIAARIEMRRRCVELVETSFTRIEISLRLLEATAPLVEAHNVRWPRAQPPR